MAMQTRFTGSAACRNTAPFIASSTPGGNTRPQMMRGLVGRRAAACFQAACQLPSAKARAAGGLGHTSVTLPGAHGQSLGQESSLGIREDIP